MGRRGPIKGKGGSPTLTEQARKKNTRQVPKVARKPRFARDLTKLTYPELCRRCSVFRPIDDKDETTVIMLWQALQRYKKLQEFCETIPVEQWGDGPRGSIPQLTQMNKAFDQVILLSGKFGLSTADALRMGESVVAGDESFDSPFAERAELIKSINEQNAKNARNKN